MRLYVLVQDQRLAIKQTLTNKKLCSGVSLLFVSKMSRVLKTHFEAARKAG